MPRQIVNGTAVKQLGASYYPVTPLDAGAANLVFTAGGDQTDRNVVIANGKTLLLAHNTDSVARTITISSVVDNLGRLGDITDYSMDPGELALFGPFLTAGWGNSGKLDYDVEDPALKTTVINIA